MISENNDNKAKTCTNLFKI